MQMHLLDPLVGYGLGRAQLSAHCGGDFGVPLAIIRSPWGSVMKPVVRDHLVAGRTDLLPPGPICCFQQQ